MKVRVLPNGNLLVPAASCVNGEIMWGMVEAKPGTPDYEDWADYVKDFTPAKAKPQFVLAGH